LLAELAQSSASALVVCPGIQRELSQKYRRTNISIVESPVDLNIAAAQCDVPVGHGSHGFTAQIRICGKPQLLRPRVLEQRLTAERMEAAGAGIVVPNSPASDIGANLRKLLSDDRYSANATMLKSKCPSLSGIDSNEAVQEVLGA
jgi:UDP:flavonoid glycosyltransferase YjiC (YdhE family)